MFEFLKKSGKLDDKRVPRFMWKEKDLNITEGQEFDPNSSLTLSAEEKQAFKEQGENKQP